MDWKFWRRRTVTRTKAAELQTSVNQVNQLDQQLQALDAQGGRLDAKRASTLAAIQDAKATREAAVESLLTARADEKPGIHRRIDSLDSAIREEERNLEALDRAADKLADELASVHQQFTAAQEQAQREQQARESEAAQAQLVELEATASRLGDEFVEALARLNIAAGKHHERGAPQSNFANALMENFVTRQRSRGGHGWNYTVSGILPNLVLEIRPMLPPGPKP
jgi:prefoldin subunit 5